MRSTATRQLGLPVGAFESLAVWAPPRRGEASARPDVAGRTFGVRSFFWTIEDFCRQELLPFLFADAEDDRQQYTLVVHNVAHRLRQFANPAGDGAVSIDGVTLRHFDDLVEFLTERVTDDADDTWRGRAISIGTAHAFVRRLHSSVRHVGHLIRADVAHPERHRVELEQQVTVIDLHNLNDRAKRFVVGVVLRRAFEAKEQSGQAHPLQFVLLDELNKYAPREGASPIKEILLDVAERGRSLGVILIGCQQTASEVERRIIANSAIRVVGPARSGRGRARRVRVPLAHPPAAGDDRQAGHDDRLPARAAGPAGRRVPVPGVGHACIGGRRQPGGGGGQRPGRSLRGPAVKGFASQAELARRACGAGLRPACLLAADRPAQPDRPAGGGLRQEPLPPAPPAKRRGLHPCAGLHAKLRLRGER